MMTRKDYERAAAIVRQHDGSGPMKGVLVDGFAMLFEGDNPRFDRERFTDACGVLASSPEPTLLAPPRKRQRGA